MTIFIGLGVVLALVVGLLLWLSRRTYKPGGPRHDVTGMTRKTRLQGKEQGAKWGSGM